MVRILFSCFEEPLFFHNISRLCSLVLHLSLLHSSPSPFFPHLCLLDACPPSFPSSHPSAPRPFISRCQSSLHKHPSDVETSWCPSFSYNTRCSPKASRVLVWPLRALMFLFPTYFHFHSPWQQAHSSCHIVSSPEKQRMYRILPSRPPFFLPTLGFLHHRRPA